MSFQQGFDPAQQGSQFENNGTTPQTAPQPQQPGMPQQQQMPDGGSPAPFAQQGAVDGATGNAGGDAKTTLW